MGMSATQARLLTITGRLTDNEMRSQTITNSKLRLAQKSSDASQEYMDALSSEKLVFKYYNDNGESSTYNLTPALLYSYEPLKNQYSIQNASGQNLVSATDVNHFENSTTLSEFLESYGLTEISQDYKKFLADMDDYNEKLNQYNIDKAKYDEDMVIQEIISDIMAKNNLSQEGMAKILGVNQTTVGQWLNGKKKPGYDSILLLYEKFGVTPNELFGID